MASDGGGSRVLGIVLALAIGAGLVWWKFGRAGEQSAEVREQIASQLAEMPDYAEHGPLYMELLDAHHGTAFDRHHSMGSRRTSARFDGEAYLSDLFAAMIADAEARGEAECAEMLRVLREELVWERG